MLPKEDGGTANVAGPGQTASLSGQTYLSKYLGKLPFVMICIPTGHLIL